MDRLSMMGFVVIFSRGQSQNETSAETRIVTVDAEFFFLSEIDE